MMYKAFATLHTLIRGAVLAFVTAPCALLQAAPPAVDQSKNEIAIVMSQEPQWLNTVKATDQVSFIVLDHISEGLMTYDINNELVGGVAVRWELTDDKATFWLRKDARWSDGKPVTAQDFVFAWQQVANPANAAEYAFLMRSFTNGEAIISGDMPPESLGVEALDEHTLVAHLTSPIAYFLELVTFISFRPVREDFFRAQGQRYAADADKMLSNGPFILTVWVHGASLRMEKNPHYWNSSAIRLDAINVPYITEDPNARFNLFMDNKIVMATGLDKSATSMAMQKRQKLKSFRDGSTFFIEFNHRPGRATGNLNLRRAMQSVFDADALTYKVIGLPGNIPAVSLFPEWLEGNSQRLVEDFPPPAVVLDPAQGRRYLELAKQELGVEEIPPLSLLLSDTPSSVKQAEYFQDVMMRTLGLEIRLDRQIFKQRLAKMSAGEFDLVAAGWAPDYIDTMTFADLFTSWNLNNRGRYKSKSYDQLVRQAQSTTDKYLRNQAFGKLQSLIFEDVVILPQYERGYIYVQNKQIEGVRRTRVGGDPNYNYAWIEGN
ncbi:MAG: peptide ABC transporter substrate-binding protein [Gammaproteobacteria bacterium]|nr:peptide ABC transporter substrate-binding protein [Gammaproteobacteria bacterium]